MVNGHLGPRELAGITALLTGPSIQLAAGPAPLAGRDLADSGREDLTVVAAVTRMRRAFGQITEVVSAAEQVWNDMTGKLDAVAAELGFSFGDLHRLEELIPKLLGKRSAPAHYDGAQRIADYLASLLPSG